MKKWVPFYHCFQGQRDEAIFESFSSGHGRGERQSLFSSVDDSSFDDSSLDTEAYEEEGVVTKIMTFLEESVVTFFNERKNPYREIGSEDSSDVSDTQSTSGSYSAGSGYQSGSNPYACQYYVDDSLIDESISSVAEEHGECCEKCTRMIKVVNDVMMLPKFPRKDRSVILRDLEKKDFSKIITILRKNGFVDEFTQKLKDAVKADKEMTRAVEDAYHLK